MAWSIIGGCMFIGEDVVEDYEKDIRDQCLRHHTPDECVRDEYDPD